MFDKKPELNMIPKDPYYIRLSGRGGQGILLAGVLIAEAGMHDGLYVAQTQSYGPEARLGASKCEVVLSTKEIAFPEVEEPDLLLCLSKDAYVKHGVELAPNGIRVVEKRVTEETDVHDALLLPIQEIAHEVGDIIVANVVALGALISLTKVVSNESIEKAIVERVKPRYISLNMKAFEAGYELGSKYSENYSY
jgi:2-oxoglutarate ferredoxin oxidoreductase subunit gamma